MGGLKHALFGAVLLLSVAGCAAGPVQPPRRFLPVDLSRLQPGISTQADLVATFGTPAKIDRLNALRTFVTYQNVDHVGDLLYLRGLELGFRGGVLSSYHYRSNYTEDSTCFDFAAARVLAMPDMLPASRSGVVAALGMPTGLTSESGLGDHHTESYECVTPDRMMHILTVVYSSATAVRRAYILEWRIPERAFR